MTHISAATARMALLRKQAAGEALPQEQAAVPEPVDPMQAAIEQEQAEMDEAKQQLMLARQKAKLAKDNFELQRDELNAEKAKAAYEAESEQFEQEQEQLQAEQQQAAEQQAMQEQQPAPEPGNAMQAAAIQAQQAAQMPKTASAPGPFRMGGMKQGGPAFVPQGFQSVPPAPHSIAATAKKMGVEQGKMAANQNASTKKATEQLEMAEQKTAPVDQKMQKAAGAAPFYFGIVDQASLNMFQPRLFKMAEQPVYGTAGSSPSVDDVTDRWSAIKGYGGDKAKKKSSKGTIIGLKGGKKTPLVHPSKAKQSPKAKPLAKFIKKSAAADGTKIARDPNKMVRGTGRNTSLSTFGRPQGGSSATGGNVQRSKPRAAAWNTLDDEQKLARLGRWNDHFTNRYGDLSESQMVTTNYGGRKVTVPKAIMDRVMEGRSVNPRGGAHNRQAAMDMRNWLKYDQLNRTAPLQNRKAPSTQGMYGQGSPGLSNRTEIGTQPTQPAQQPQGDYYAQHNRKLMDLARSSTQAARELRDSERKYGITADQIMAEGFVTPEHRSAANEALARLQQKGREQVEMYDQEDYDRHIAPYIEEGGMI